jgi:hypothetical protein
LEEYFNRYRRDIIRLWAQSYTRLTEEVGMGLLAEAAAQVVLTQLRGHEDLPGLLHSYATETGADLTLISSLVPSDPGSELPWLIRDSAYHLRWLEIAGAGR